MDSLPDHCGKVDAQYSQVLDGIDCVGFGEQDFIVS